MTYINNNPKRPPTLDELIDQARQDLEKFKFIISDYPKKNPIKALAKQEEFVVKLEAKEKHLEDLLAMKEKQHTFAKTQQEEDQNRAQALEARRQAELEAAKELGRREALAEMEKNKKVENKSVA